MKKALFLVLGVVPAVLLARRYDPPISMIVVDPVVDVRSSPTPHTGGYVQDPYQETQLEKGEPVLVFERQGKWARLEAPEQMEYTHNERWQGYPGWVGWSSLSPNLKNLREIQTPPISDQDLRKKILEKAALHVGNPYYWGGCSLTDPANKRVVTGVDCSGLVFWSYRQMGVKIPRDAHEQWMRAFPLDPGALKPADLVFLASKENPRKIVHVALVGEGEEIIEAPQSGENVHRTTFQSRFGKTRLAFKNAEVWGDRVFYFGSLLAERP